MIALLLLASAFLLFLIWNLLGDIHRTLQSIDGKLDRLP